MHEALHWRYGLTKTRQWGDLFRNFNPSGECRLREIAMFRTTSKILLRAGFALAVFCSWPPGVSIGQTVCAAASVSPASVAAGTSPSMTLITNGTIDLGNVTTQQFGIRPTEGISDYKITAQSAQGLQFSMDIVSSATTGPRTLFVNDASGHEVVALDVNITPSSPVCIPACQIGTSCTSGGCRCNPLVCTQIDGRCVGDRCIPLGN
jgi:hypothetical protein